MREKFDPKTGYDPANVARSDKIEINAPASVVWNILTDLKRYGEWNPFCIKAESTLAMGAPVNMSITSTWNPGEVSQVVEYVCAFEPERLLSWEMHWTEAWPYAARRDQVIESLGPAECRYYSTDAFFGDTGVHVMRFAGPWVKAGFDATARALKKRAEDIYASQHQKSVRA
jgi:hypothetical protein